MSIVPTGKFRSPLEGAIIKACKCKGCLWKRAVDKNYWKAKAGSAEYEEAKQKFIDLAIEIVAEKGVNKFRFDELAKRAGCVRTTIYRYFDSKDELLSEVVTALMYHMAIDIVEYMSAKRRPSKASLGEGIYQTIKRLQTDSRYKVVMDADNIRFFTEMSVEKMPEKMGPILSIYMSEENGKSLLRNDLTIEEACSWMALQIITFAQFGLPGKTEKQQKEYVMKMIVSVLIADEL